MSLKVRLPAVIFFGQIIQTGSILLAASTENALRHNLYDLGKRCLIAAPPLRILTLLDFMAMWF